MNSPETEEAILKVSLATSIEPAALLAICSVESGGRVFARVGGKLEPLIRFEGHYFDRRLTGVKRKRARAEGLASPRAGVVANPRTQAGRWALLRKAEAIDRTAARESVSWGVGQVMGAHWAWLGYRHVDDLVTDARSGAAGQVRLMVRYIRKADLLPAIKARDWAGFARGYNGPGYKKYKYDVKIGSAYRKFAKRYGGGSAVAINAGTLRIGNRGAAVADLQHNLKALGYLLRVDGDFGPATQKAVRQFQAGHGLPSTGIADQNTEAAIRSALPSSSLVSRISKWFLGLIGFSRKSGGVRG